MPLKIRQLELCAVVKRVAYTVVSCADNLPQRQGNSTDNNGKVSSY